MSGMSSQLNKIARHRSRKYKHDRTVSSSYSFTVYDKDVRVCEKFFSATLHVDQNTVRNAVKLQNSLLHFKGGVLSEQRGPLSM